MKKVGIPLDLRSLSSRQSKHLEHPMYGVLYPTLQADAVELAKTADYTILDADFGKWMTNEGDNGAIVFTLPAYDADEHEGKVIGFKALAAQQISVSPNSANMIFLAGDGVANKDLVIAGTIGNFAVIAGYNGAWHCVQANGVVTKEG